MHSTVITSLVLVCLGGALAQSHDGMLKQNHHNFLRVKRGGSTIHLIGDETLARWSGGSVPSLPKPSVVAPLTTSYTNLMDSINAGLGVPVGRATASPSSSSSSESFASTTPSSSVASTTSSSSSLLSTSPKVAAVSSKASTSSKAASSSAKKTTSKSSSSSKSTSSAAQLKTGAALAAARPSAAKVTKRNVAFNATVAEGIDESHINALGRRAVGNSTEEISASSVDAAAASSASDSSVDSAAPSASAAASPDASISFSAGDLTTSQGWGAAFANKYTSMSVNNHGVRGASARSIYRDLWTGILGSVRSGDYVLLQLGHYDGAMPGSAQDTAEGCVGAAPGGGSSTMTITSGCTGAPEVVMSFSGYLTQMCKDVQAKGATCLIASLTPKNKFSGNSLNYNSPYTSQAKSAASAAGATYIPHLETIAKTLSGSSATVAQQNYWLSGNALQSNNAGADIFAASFAAAAACAGVSGVSPGVAAAGQAIQAAC